MTCRLASRSLRSDQPVYNAALAGLDKDLAPPRINRSCVVPDRYGFGIRSVALIIALPLAT